MPKRPPRLQVPNLEIQPASLRYRWFAVGFLSGLVLGGALFFLGPQARSTAASFVADVGKPPPDATPAAQVAYGARKELAAELRAVNDRNLILDEDLAYALRLMPVGGPEDSVRLERFIVRPDAMSAESFYFSLLVGYESGRKPQEFSGDLLFTLTVERSGQRLELPWPAPDQLTEAERLQGYQVKTRHWTRKTGTLMIPPGDVLKKVEVRLLQGAVVRASSVLTL